MRSFKSEAVSILSNADHPARFETNLSKLSPIKKQTDINNSQTLLISYQEDFVKFAFNNDASVNLQLREGTQSSIIAEELKALTSKVKEINLRITNNLETLNRTQEANKRLQDIIRNRETSLKNCEMMNNGVSSKYNCTTKCMLF